MVATVYVNSAGHGGTETIALNNPARVRDDVRSPARHAMGFSLWEFEIYGDTPPSPGTNIALGEPTTASSVESSAYSPSNAVDGQKSTRWSSAFADPQWITVDLGGTFDISRVVLNWEAAYASVTYPADLERRGVTWNTFRTVSRNHPTEWTTWACPQSDATSGCLRLRAGLPGACRLGIRGGRDCRSFGPNLARTGTATASSAENANFTPDKAIDGNLQTRWSSAFADSQSIVIDLGSVQPVRRVILRWEAAYSNRYSVQLLQQSGRRRLLHGGLAVGRTWRRRGLGPEHQRNRPRIRVFCATRATPYGCSPFEAEVCATR